jgi:hypothetical protein
VASVAPVKCRTARSSGWLPERLRREDGLLVVEFSVAVADIERSSW